jgi:hypothetical protein
MQSDRGFQKLRVNRYLTGPRRTRSVGQARGPGEIRAGLQPLPVTRGR